MNALLIFLDEPIQGHAAPMLSAELGPDKGVLHYRAVIAVLLRQLEGMKDVHVRICYSPDDGGEAVTFWILPQMRGKVVKRASDYLFTPEKHAPSITIDFVPQGPGDVRERTSRATEQAFREGFRKVALLDGSCPECGGRWIQTALLQLKGASCVIGPADDGGCYFLAASEEGAHWLARPSWDCQKQAHADAAAAGLKPLALPPLGKIQSRLGWETALAAPIGGKLRSALKREIS